MFYTAQTNKTSINLTDSPGNASRDGSVVGLLGFVVFLPVIWIMFSLSLSFIFNNKRMVINLLSRQHQRQYLVYSWFRSHSLVPLHTQHCAYRGLGAFYRTVSCGLGLSWKNLPTWQALHVD